MRKGNAAFSVTDLLITLLALALMAVFVLPIIINPRPHVHRMNWCTNNLRQIGLSFRTWSLDNNDRFPTQVPVAEGGAMEPATNGSVWPIFQVMSNELSTPKILLCPQDPTRKKPATSYGADLTHEPGSVPISEESISYFVSLDAMHGDEQVVLSGDRTLERAGKLLSPGLNIVTPGETISWSRKTHAENKKHSGNLLFADGSVQEVKKPLAALFPPGTNSVRLLIP